MRDVAGLWLSAVAAVVISGCAPSPMDDQYWAQRRPLGETYEVYHPPAYLSTDNDAESDRPTANPQGPLTLADALAAALLGSPELTGFAYQVRAAEAQALQAGLLPNPELEVEFENFAGSGEFSGSQSLDTTVALSQAIPLGGDIRYQREAARLHGQLTGWDYEAHRIALLTDVTQRYIAVLQAQRQLQLTQQSLKLAEQISDSIAKRVEAGDVPDIENARVAVPVVVAQIAQGKAERALQSARRRLAETWGASSPEFTEATGDIESLAPVPPINELASRLSQNPDLARWAVEVSARRAEVQLAKAQAVPDLTGTIGYRRIGGSDDDALVAGLSIPLSVFDRNQGGIQSARFDVASAQAQKKAAELRIGSALSSAHAELIDAYSEATTLRQRAIPPALDAYQAVSKAYDQGNLSFLDVLDADRTLIDIQQQYLDALTAYHKAVAEVEGLIGQPLRPQNNPTQTNTHKDAPENPEDQSHE